MPILYAIARYIGVGFCCCLVLLWHYEGIPGAAKLKLPDAWHIVGGLGILDIPVIGDLTVGKVQAYAADQVKIATAAQQARFDAKLEKMVAAAEVTAAKAQMDREKTLRRVADDAAAEADNRARVSGEAQRAAEAEVARLREEAEKIEGLSRPNARDREWQSKH